MSTVDTMTLADFLLARISELEAAIRLSFLEDPFAEEPVFRDLGLSVDPALLLARCAADRAVVAWATDEYADNLERGKVLPLLASAYADHEDYREDWANG